MTVSPAGEIILGLCLYLIATFVGVGVRGVADRCKSHLESGRHVRVWYSAPENLCCASLVC